MEESRYTSIGDVVLDESFPEVDLALRRGRHIDRDDGAWYALLVDGQAELEVFYRRFGCELVRKSDGYFYLLPSGDKLGRRQLSVAEMLVGQGLALLLLDPCTVESGGVVTRDDVLAHLARVMGPAALVKALNPKKKRLDERVAQETVRNRVAEALRKLASLGFLEPLEGNRLRLRTALMRFAEPVRSAESPEKSLEQLVMDGEIVMGSADDGEGEGDPDADDDANDEPTQSANPGDAPDSDVNAHADANAEPAPSANPTDTPLRDAHADANAEPAPAPDPTDTPLRDVDADANAEPAPAADPTDTPLRDMSPHGDPNAIAGAGDPTSPAHRSADESTSSGNEAPDSDPLGSLLGLTTGEPER